MMAKEIRESIKTIYGMLWEILALYEKTDCSNKVPENETEKDIWDYLGDKLMSVRKNIDMLFLGQEEPAQRLREIVDETEAFVRRYERPGVVKRWKRINPQILFFECSFEIMEKFPEVYKEISWGLSNLKLACYPDENLIAARKKYFAEANRKIEEGNLQYTEERVFQNELLRTLTLVFEHDFKEYL